MDIDEVFRERVGEMGQYQMIIFLIICSIHFYAAFHMIHMVFVGEIPKHFDCIKPVFLRASDICPTNFTCEEYKYHDNFTSIATEWNLVCRQSYKSNLVQSIYMGGVLLGALVFGFLSDKIGRRKCMLVCTILMAFCSLLAGLLPFYTEYAALRFLVGVFEGGLVLVSFVLATEVVGSTKRATVGMVLPTMFAFGIATYALFAYLIRDWRHLSFTVSVPAFVLAGSLLFLPESPRWLLSCGKVSDAEKLLEQFAFRNGRARCFVVLSGSHMRGTAATSFTTLFSNSFLRFRTAVLFLGWMTVSGAYYGLTTSAGDLGSNKYVGVALSGLIEVPAYILLPLFLDRLGRRFAYSGSMMIGGIACIAIFYLRAEKSLLVSAFALTGKVAISCSFSVAYLYSAELYPTVVRSNGMSVCSMGARIGGVLSPFVNQLGSFSAGLQYLIFGLFACTFGAVSSLLPETVGQPMMETIDDLSRSQIPLLESAYIKQKSPTEEQVKMLEENIAANEEEIKGQQYKIYSSRI